MARCIVNTTAALFGSPHLFELDLRCRTECEYVERSLYVPRMKGSQECCELAGIQWNLGFSW
jgi:hypothetical protein